MEEIFKLKPIQKNIAHKMGEEELCCQTAEELAELIQVLMTYRRVKGCGQPTSKKMAEVMYSMHEEVVDAVICIKELIYLLGLSDSTLEYIENQKVRRTTQRYGIKEE